MGYDLNKLRAAIGSVAYYDVCDSTNVRAKQDNNARDGALILSAAQTGGKGRHSERRFFSPVGGIYMSVTVRDCADFGLLTSAAAAAVRRALKDECGVECGIKWVNDLYIEGKKVCGILSEGLSDNGKMTGAIVGIGINYAGITFPDELNSAACCVYEGKPAVPAEDVIIAVWRNLMHFAHNIEKRDFLRDCREYSILLARQVAVTLPDGAFVATAEDVDNNGGLIVRLASGENRTVTAGEVTKIRL